MFRPAGVGRTATPTAAADRPCEHSPSQAVGALDRRRDVNRERAEIATIEDHRPPCTGFALDPPSGLVVDGPGHTAALDRGAIREAVERRLELLVKREPQAQSGNVIQARGEPTEGQCQSHEESDRDACDEAHAILPGRQCGQTAQQISLASYGLDQPRSPCLEGAAQRVDVNVQRVGDEVVSLAPDVPVDPRARENLIGMTEEKDKNCELLGRQVQGMAGTPGLLRRQVNAHVAIRKRHVRERAPATYQGAGAGEQLLEGKRLAEIIVGTGVKPAHPVADRVARCQEEHGRGPTLAAMILQDSKAVASGQPPVEDHKVPFAVPQRVLARIAVASVHDRESLVRQPVDNRSSEACVVLDHQNPACHSDFSDPLTSPVATSDLS